MMGPDGPTIVGDRAPSSSDLGLVEKGKQLPLHIKPVAGAIDIDARVPCATPGIWDRWIDARGWLNDEAKYAGLQATGPPPTAKLSNKEVEILASHGSVAPLPVGWAVKGHVNIFGMPEHIGTEKARRRVIKEAITINDGTDRSTLLGFRAPTRAWLRAAVFRGKWVLCLDAAAFFDQFKYASIITRLMVFKSKDGRLWRSLLLAMGQRQASDVAQALMAVLRDFHHAEGCTSDFSADNIRFVADSYDAIMKTALEFIQRCATFGVILNEVDVKASLADVAQALSEKISHVGDFWGEILDHQKKTACLRTKTAEKAGAIWAIRNEWTWRQAIGAIALGLWAAPVFGLRMHDFYAVFAVLRKSGKLLQDDPNLWDTRACIDDAATLEIGRLLAPAIRNAPHAITAARDDTPHQVIFTDASRWGWGAISVRTDDWSVQWAHQPWNSAFAAHAHASADAEPEAIWRAAARFLQPRVSNTALLVTDHSAFPDVLRRGFSASARINAIVGRLATRFPWWHIRAAYAPGATNPADQLSRGLVSRLSQTDIADIRRMTANLLLEQEATANADSRGLGVKGGV